MSDQEYNPEESPTSEAIPKPPDVLFTNSRLRFAYPIIEVAKIAAGFDGKSPRNRVYGAIAVLEAVERCALSPDAAKFRNLKIFEIAERHEKNGLILLTELLLSIIKTIGKPYKAETAQEKYRQWLKEDYEINAFDFDDVTYEARHVSFETHRKRYETGRPKCVRSDAAAQVIIAGFSKWLEDNKSSKKPAPLRDATTKKIVSKKNKGSRRDGKGRYDTKPAE